MKIERDMSLAKDFADNLTVHYLEPRAKHYFCNQYSDRGPSLIDWEHFNASSELELCLNCTNKLKKRVRQSLHP